jgi:hypothetical protein
MAVPPYQIEQQTCMALDVERNDRRGGQMSALWVFLEESAREISNKKWADASPEADAVSTGNAPAQD